MKAIIFDFDGTLADSGECGLLATQKAFKECNLSIPTKKVVDYYMGIPIEQSFHEMTNHTLDEDLKIHCMSRAHYYLLFPVKRQMYYIEIYKNYS